MQSSEDLILPIIVITLFILSMVGVVVVLLVINSNRGHRHRAELAERDLKHGKEVILAEREATEQTLGEVGRELHDNVGQLLTVAQMCLRNKQESLIQSDDQLTSAMELLAQSIDEVGRLGRSLNSDIWTDRSFEEAVRIEAARIERSGQMSVNLNIVDTPIKLSSDTKTILFRMIQESIGNSIKHSGAQLLEVSIKSKPSLVITISDNGRGFDEDSIEKGSGLGNIRRRAELIGFEAALSSRPGKGCKWTFNSIERYAS